MLAGLVVVLPPCFRVLAGLVDVVPPCFRVLAGLVEVLPPRFRVLAGLLEVLPTRFRARRRPFAAAQDQTGFGSESLRIGTRHEAVWSMPVLGMFWVDLLACGPKRGGVV